MFNYPPDLVGPCLENRTMGDVCHSRGICVPDRTLCQCDLYYDPLSNCSLNIFDIVEAEAGIYAGVAMILTILIMSAYLLEVVKDCQFTKKPLKTPTFYAKLCVVVLYGGCALMSIFFMVAGLINRTAAYAYTDLIFRYIATSIFGSTYLITGVHFLTILLRAKKLGANTKEILAFRWIIIVLILVCVPAIITMDILSLYGIGLPHTDTFSRVILIIMLLVSLLAMAYEIVKCYIWFYRSDEILKSSKKMQLVRQKTIIITVITVWLILTSMLIPATGNFDPDLPQVILYRKWIAMMSEVTTLTIMWFFLQNHLGRTHGGNAITSSTSSQGSGSRGSRTTRTSTSRTSARRNRHTRTQTMVRTEVVVDEPEKRIEESVKVASGSSLSASSSSSKSIEMVEK